MALRSESTVSVLKPPAEVFPWLLDADKVPRWMTGLVLYEPVEPGPLKVGRRIRQHLSMSGRQLHFELHVAELDPPHWAVLRFEGSGFKAANEYAVREVTGGSDVTWVIAGKATSFKTRLLASIFQAKLQEKLDGDLARLRALLEGQVAAA